jgi:hypothetical protein
VDVHELPVATWGADCAGAIEPDWKSSLELPKKSSVFDVPDETELVCDVCAGWLAFASNITAKKSASADAKSACFTVDARARAAATREVCGWAFESMASMEPRTAENRLRPG